MKIKWLKEDTLISPDIGEKKEKVKKGGTLKITPKALKNISHYKGYFEVIDEPKESNTPRVTNEAKKVEKNNFKKS